MHNSQNQLIEINKNITSKINELNFKDYTPKIIAVTKTFKLDKIKR